MSQRNSQISSPRSKCTFIPLIFTVGEKPNLCPNEENLTLRPGMFCQTDHQCPHELKCCKNSDGDMGCVQPRPKTTCAETVCDEDASCLQKHDVAVCVSHTKVGHCPLIATALRPCKKARVLCEVDEDCEGDDILLHGPAAR
ncbi:uncharacterized protein LOC119110008 [Pollicipes pollicipes]|uniref:uncharacterized protein LOC119110008 n=1 Tax=Pollicipes pollicipes TaxID=41117 RepID=UPI0018852747|nr:uncharacterized protein LOC119110008 [Pollicipes pollicipes]